MGLECLSPSMMLVNIVSLDRRVMNVHAENYASIERVPQQSYIYPRVLLSTTCLLVEHLLIVIVVR